MTEGIIHKSFRYRLYPTKCQADTLTHTLDLCRELYNASLQERRDAWRLNRVSVGFYSQDKQLTEIKREREDVAAVHWSALSDTLHRVDKAFKRFFERVKKGQTPGYPRFKPASRYDSFTLRQIGNALNCSKLRISKVGEVKIKLHRPLEGTIKQLHVKRECGKWYAIFAVECEPKPLPECTATVGIDVGLAAFATLSDGTEIENPRWYREAKAKFRRAARKVARRKKGSRRRRKAIELLRAAHTHIREQRADFHHKISRWLVNNHGLIAVEDLNVKGLAAGRLAKSVNDAGWSSFIYKLLYKAESAGRAVMKVDCRGTSQTCVCGAEVRKTLSQRWHSCESCGLSLPRDHVSAQVILQRAVRCQASTCTVA
jgi:putative transposase